MDIDVEFVEEKSPLTKAENQVGALLPRGLTIKEMAVSLHRSVKTVETHLGHIYQKLDVVNDKQAITVMFLRGIVKARQALLLCLVVCSAGNAVLPSQAYARTENDWSEAPVDAPMNRMRVRGGTQARTGSRLQLRRPTRRRED